MTTGTTEVDATDDVDSHETEAAIALALAQTLHDNHSTGAIVPIGLSSAPWDAVVHAAVAYTLLNYATRSTRQFGHAAGLTSADATRYANDIGGTTTRDAVSRIAKQANDLAVAAHAEPTTTDQYRRLRVGSAGLAREAATYVREAARFKIATDLGAIDKTWRTKRDLRVRPAHGGIEGDTVPTGESFHTIDGPIRFPGDPLAKPSLTYGCRCHLSYRVPAPKELVDA